MKKLIPLCVFFVLAFFVSKTFLQTPESPFEIKRWSVQGKLGQKKPLRIALLSDFHLPDNAAGLERVKRIIASVRFENPDIVLLAGDYDRKRSPNSLSFNKKVVDLFSQLTAQVPVFAVLGNHDNVTNRKAWMDLWESSRVTFIEGRLHEFMVKRQKVCLRGLGDSFSGYYINSVPFDGCSGVKLTLTHDPYAAQLNFEGGVFFAGHTHCSQINLPVLNFLWTPTRARYDLWCGVNKLSDRTVVTSAGLGYSILPLRIGAPASWDLVTIKAPGQL